MVASAAKYCKKGAVNQSAASAASPDSVKFQAVIKSAASAASRKPKIKETQNQENQGLHFSDVWKNLGFGQRSLRGSNFNPSPLPFDPSPHPFFQHLAALAAKYSKNVGFKRFQSLFTQKSRFDPTVKSSKTGLSMDPCRFWKRPTLFCDIWPR